MALTQTDIEILNKYGIKPDVDLPQTEETSPAVTQQEPTTAPAQPEKKPGLLDKGLNFLEKTGETIGNVGIGALKGAGSTVAGASALGEKIISAPFKVAGVDTGKPLGEQIQQSGALTPTNAAQKAGFAAEQVGEFFVPGMAGSKVLKAGQATSKAVTVAGKAAEAVGAADKAVAVAPKLVDKTIGLVKATAKNVFDSSLVTAIQTGGNVEETKKAAKGAAIATPAFAGAGAAAKKVMSLGPKESERIINSLIRPLEKDFAYSKNPGRGVSAEKITASSLGDLEEKIIARKNEIGKQIRTKLTEATKNGVKISMETKRSPIDEAIAKLEANSPRTNETSIKRLKDAKMDLLHATIGPNDEIIPGRKLFDLTPEEAFDMKQDIADLTRFTGAPSDDKVVNKALKETYGIVKQAINEAVPGLKKKNERYADLLSAEVATKHREKIVERNNMINTGAKIGGVGGAMLAILAGNPPAAATVALAGLSGVALDKIARSTAFKTRAAALLSSMPEEQVAELAKRAPTLWVALTKVFGSNVHQDGQNSTK